jgi:DNA (cytosine-5)-methyltransferase 1
VNVLSLFSGIGGLDLGFERAGFTVVGQVEIDPFCQRVLRKHWPGVPLHDDVHTTSAWWRSEPRPTVDVVAGGFPCQPVSDAGKRLADTDSRWLWPAFRDVVADVRPRWTVVENVRGLYSRGLDIVMDDLATLGYIAIAGDHSGPHRKPRMDHAAG